VVQAFGGVMSITGEPGREPVRCGLSFVDLTTGILCALGVLAALRTREQTGRGQRVDGSLLETAVGLLNYHAESYLLTGEVPRPLGSAHPALAPYRIYRCRDGQWVFVAGANDRLWRRLAGAIGLEALLSDPRFATNLERVRREPARTPRRGRGARGSGKPNRSGARRRADALASPDAPNAASEAR
jgi:crotonobetainyl-CoA:carnitine CoA-transferase CaiB-like acyl-CoA transferase